MNVDFVLHTCGRIKTTNMNVKIKLCKSKEEAYGSTYSYYNMYMGTDKLIETIVVDEQN